MPDARRLMLYKDIILACDTCTPVLIKAAASRMLGELCREQSRLACHSWHDSGGF